MKRAEAEDPDYGDGDLFATEETAKAVKNANVPAGAATNSLAATIGSTSLASITDGGNQPPPPPAGSSNEVPLLEMDIESVCEFLVKLTVPPVIIQKFRAESVDGKLLAALSDDDLKNDLSVSDATLRTKIITEVTNLRERTPGMNDLRLCCFCVARSQPSLISPIA